MRNLDPVLIERANQVSFFGGGGNLVNREYLNAVSRFSSRFPETDDLEENQRLFLRARLEGWQELVYKAYSDRLRRRSEFVSWMVAGRSNYNFKRAQKQLDAERRAEESFAAKMAAINWRGLFPPRGRSKPTPMAVMIPSLPATRWLSKSCKPALII